MKHTIKDVARLSGVSLGTVSNVLNKLPSVSEKKRALVLKAIEELNYSPNVAARTLKTKRSKTIGLIIPDINNPFYPEFARGVEDTAQIKGYSLFLCNSDRNTRKERDYMDALSEKVVDGLILFKPHMSKEDLRDYGSRINIVLVDYGKSAGTGCSVVKTDDYAAVGLALEYLWRYRHRRIAMISGTRDSQSSRDRIKSYRDFVAAKNLKLPGEYLQGGDYDWHSGYTSAVNLLNMKKPPTAVLAANDLMAIGAMKAISDRGLHIPGDISVMGYDDIDMASLITPALTTIKQPKYEMGQCSVNILIDLIENDKGKKNYEPSVQLIKTRIVERQSVGIPLSHAREP